MILEIPIRNWNSQKVWSKNNSHKILEIPIRNWNNSILSNAVGFGSNIRDTYKELKLTILENSSHSGSSY